MAGNGRHPRCKLHVAGVHGAARQVAARISKTRRTSRVWVLEDGGVVIRKASEDRFGEPSFDRFVGAYTISTPLAVIAEDLALFMPEKPCTLCERVLPFTSFNLRPDGKPRGQCRQCDAGARSARRANAPLQPEPPDPLNLLFRALPPPRARLVGLPPDVTGYRIAA